MAAPITTTTRDDDNIDHCDVTMAAATMAAAAPKETGGGEDGVVGGRRGRITKALMSDDDLFEYFKLRLGGDTVCPNEGSLPFNDVQSRCLCSSGKIFGAV